MRRNHRPKHGHTLHLSTLVHQVLSIIAGRGGATASTLLDILCAHGPFQAVDRPLSVRILRYLGDPDRQLLEQAPDGVLLLGEQRERVVAHFRFFAVFQTPDEFRVIAEGRTLGPLPVTFMLMEDMAIIFAGQRWRVLEVDDRARTITVTPEHRGIPPIFGESGGELHARVVQTMLDIYQGLDMPRYLDETARTLLREGREEFTRLDLVRSPLLPLETGIALLFPWCDTVTTEALKDQGLLATASHRIVVAVEANPGQVLQALKALAHKPPPSALDLAHHVDEREREKFHRYLSHDLLAMDMASARIRTDDIPRLALSLWERGRSRTWSRLGTVRLPA